VIPLNALNRFGRLIRKMVLQSLCKTTLNENTVLYVSVDEHGKIAGNVAFKKTIIPHLVLEKITKFNRKVSRKN
jgi:hypothetical protein